MARGERRGRRPRRKVCHFCANKIEDIDYKDVPTLRKYTSERGAPEPGVGLFDLWPMSGPVRKAVSR